MGAEYTGNLIAQARREKGLTQKQLAEKLQVTDKAVSKWERGLNYPDISLLGPLSAALEIPIAQLVGAEDSGTEQALEAISEISREEKKALRRELKTRWWFTLCTSLIIMCALIYASYLFHLAGMYGLPQMVTGGTFPLAGIIAGDAIRSLITLKKI